MQDEKRLSKPIVSFYISPLIQWLHNSEPVSKNSFNISYEQVRIYMGITRNFLTFKFHKEQRNVEIQERKEFKFLFLTYILNCGPSILQENDGLNQRLY